jgi:hypothetical protein
MARTISRSRLVAVVLACAGLGAAWIITPAGVPLYDGIGFPDEPYRYVQPPPGAEQTPPPTDAIGHTPASGGTNGRSMQILSDETGPQVLVLLPPHDLVGPDTATSFELRAHPLAPDAKPPPGTTDGNVYRVQATASPPGPVTLRISNPAFLPEIDLRAVVATKERVTVAHRDTPDGSWRTLATDQIGNDIYATYMVGLGDYVLTTGAPADTAGSAMPGRTSGPSAAGGPTRAAPTAGRGFGVGLLGLVVLLAVFVATVIAIRLIRTRRRPS